MVIAFYVQKQSTPLNRNPERVTVKVADGDDFVQIATFVDKFRVSTRIAERTQRGDVCVVVYSDGAVAHVRWAALIPLALPELNFTLLQLDPDEAYMYDGYTLPAFRRRGFAARARDCLITYLAHRGVTTIYRLSRTDNPWIYYSRMKQNREGRQRTLGVIRVSTLLGSTRCMFYSTTEAHRHVLTRLFNLSSTMVYVTPPLLANHRGIVTLIGFNSSMRNPVHALVVLHNP